MRLAAELLAAQLARSVAGSGAVCLRCPRVEESEPLLTLSRSPFSGLPAVSSTLLLAVFAGVEEGYGAAAGCAARGVAEVWLLDPQADFLERLWLPSRKDYRRRELILPGEELELKALPGIRITPVPNSPES